MKGDCLEKMVMTIALVVMTVAEWGLGNRQHNASCAWGGWLADTGRCSDEWLQAICTEACLVLQFCCRRRERCGNWMSRLGQSDVSWVSGQRLIALRDTSYAEGGSSVVTDMRSGERLWDERAEWPDSAVLDNAPARWRDRQFARERELAIEE